jgi:hypothetical protein
MLPIVLAAILPVLMPADATAHAPRYVRMRLAVVAYGIRGTGEMLVDRQTGRFVRRFDAGPGSEREGWDGTHAWRADATGMARVEGNVDQRDAIRAWSYAFARAPQTGVRAVAGSDGTELRYATLARAIGVVRDPASGLVLQIVRHPGWSREFTRLTDQRTVDGLVLPFEITDQSNNGIWQATVTGIETPARVDEAAFAPPPAPHDVTLRGVTTVPLERDVDYPVVLVRVNGGRPLRFLLDTGGQNVITPEAARRCGMTIVGAGSVDGAGPNLMPIRYAWARREQVGAAVLRDQPFVVLDLGGTLPADGIIGYELLARLAARLDTRHHLLQLAPTAAAFGTPGTAVPFIYDERQPEVAGALDGVAGPAGVDTGDNGSVQVYTAFVRAHDLLHRYRTVLDRSAYGGVGGMVDAYLARGRTLRLGTVAVHDVRLQLTTATRGMEADPSTALQVGDEVLGRFVVIFDYPEQLLRFVAR